MASTLALETTQSRAPTLCPSSLPASIQRKTVGRDLQRMRPASYAGISAPVGAVAGALSHASRMASRWAGARPESASRMAAMARRVWGFIREGVGVFMCPFYEVKRGDCKPIVRSNLRMIDS